LPRFAERVLIFGDGPLAAQLLSELRSHPELGLCVVAQIPGEIQENRLSPGPNGAASLEELAGCVGRHRVNRIIIAMEDRRGKLPVEQLLSMKSRGIVIQDGTNLYETITGRIPTDSLRLGWLLFSEGFHVSRALLAYKQLVSIVVSLVGLVLCLPLIPFIALAVKSSPGPVLYRQKRVGRDGSVFDCLKFRTMRADAEADSGPTWTGDNDPRITRVGQFLRLSRLDEIPQLWNVLKGDMSFVGPRPERPEFVGQLTQAIPHYQLRHTVRPGLTGWAQVRYKYANTLEDSKQKLQFDLFYIKNISVGLDLLILFETLKIVLIGRGAK
jgi:sugar transferase (PEP-CTERM system associated)